MPVSVLSPPTNTLYQQLNLVPAPAVVSVNELPISVNPEGVTLAGAEALLFPEKSNKMARSPAAVPAGQVMVEVVDVLDPKNEIVPVNGVAAGKNTGNPGKITACTRQT